MAELAVGAAALTFIQAGFQVSNRIISYYKSLNAFDADLGEAYEGITELNSTFAYLKTVLTDPAVDESQKKRVDESLARCREGLKKLEEELNKFTSDPNTKNPSSTYAKLPKLAQKTVYAFHHETREKLQETVNSLLMHLYATLHILGLQDTIKTHKSVSSIWERSQEISLRLQQVAAQNEQDQFQKCLDWLQAPEPWTNHQSARSHHEDGTGRWLLQSTLYRDWKHDDRRSLWLTGLPGCGKTVLCSTIVEDIQKLCKQDARADCAAFYFTFADKQKQSLESLLRSLLAQIGDKEPARSQLLEEYSKPNKRRPDIETSERIISSAIQKSSRFFLLLDALDECPDDDDNRLHVLDFLQRFYSGAPNTHILVTSRGIGDIRSGMDALHATLVPVTTELVNRDIAQYVSRQLEVDPKLNMFSPATKDLIRNVFAEKAGGMFRWAYCQLQELKRLKSPRASYIKQALEDLPLTLDATYERILLSIDQRYHDEVLRGLRCLAFAGRPLSIEELSEASIIKPNENIFLDPNERADADGTIELWSALVVVERKGRKTLAEDTVHNHLNHQARILEERGFTESDQVVRLAHYSIKEYLTSDRIKQSKANHFHLEAGREHRLLTRACLAYLTSYSNNPRRLAREELKDAVKRDSSYHWHAVARGLSRGLHGNLEGSSQGKAPSTKDDMEDPDQSYYSRDAIEGNLRDLEAAGLSRFYHFAKPFGDFKKFPFLTYAIQHCWYHASQQHTGNVNFEVDFLNTRSYVEDLNHLRHLLPQGVVNPPGSASTQGSANSPGFINTQGPGGWRLSISDVRGIHYPCYFGLTQITRALLVNDGRANPSIDDLYTCLLIAITGGQQKIVELLVDEAGAKVNHVGDYSTALIVAASCGTTAIAEWLIDQGAAVNLEDKSRNTALWAASCEGHFEMVRLLIDRGAQIDSSGWLGDTALCAASGNGRVNIVKLLVQEGADVNGGNAMFGCTPLIEAASFGNAKIVNLLINAGADKNAAGDEGTALWAASKQGHTDVVKLLIARGANVNAQGGNGGSALYIASAMGHLKTVELLIKRHANVNLYGGQLGTPLQAATGAKHLEVAKVLLDNGAELHARRKDLLSKSDRAIDLKLEGVSKALSEGDALKPKGSGAKAKMPKAGEQWR